MMSGGDDDVLLLSQLQVKGTLHRILPRSSYGASFAVVLTRTSDARSKRLQHFLNVGGKLRFAISASMTLTSESSEANEDNQELILRLDEEQYVSFKFCERGTAEKWNIQMREALACSIMLSAFDYKTQKRGTLSSTKLSDSLLMCSALINVEHPLLVRGRFLLAARRQLNELLMRFQCGGIAFVSLREVQSVLNLCAQDSELSQDSDLARFAKLKEVLQQSSSSASTFSHVKAAGAAGGGGGGGGGAACVEEVDKELDILFCELDEVEEMMLADLGLDTSSDMEEGDNEDEKSKMDKESQQWGEGVKCDSAGSESSMCSAVGKKCSGESGSSFIVEAVAVAEEEEGENFHHEAVSDDTTPPLAIGSITPARADDRSLPVAMCSPAPRRRDELMQATPLPVCHNDNLAPSPSSPAPPSFSQMPEEEEEEEEEEEKVVFRSASPNSITDFPGPGSEEKKVAAPSATKPIGTAISSSKKVATLWITILFVLFFLASGCVIFQRTSKQVQKEHIIERAPVLESSIRQLTQGLAQIEDEEDEEVRQEEVEGGQEEVENFTRNPLFMEEEVDEEMERGQYAKEKVETTTLELNFQAQGNKSNRGIRPSRTNSVFRALAKIHELTLGLAHKVLIRALSGLLEFITPKSMEIKS